MPFPDSGAASQSRAPVDHRRPRSRRSCRSRNYTPGSPGDSGNFLGNDLSPRSADRHSHEQRWDRSPNMADPAEPRRTEKARRALRVAPIPGNGGMDNRSAHRLRQRRDPELRPAPSGALSRQSRMAREPLDNWMSSCSQPKRGTIVRASTEFGQVILFVPGIGDPGGRPTRRGIAGKRRQRCL